MYSLPINKGTDGPTICLELRTILDDTGEVKNFFLTTNWLRLIYGLSITPLNCLVNGRWIIKEVLYPTREESYITGWQGTLGFTRQAFATRSLVELEVMKKVLKLTIHHLSIMM